MNLFCRTRASLNVFPEIAILLIRLENTNMDKQFYLSIAINGSGSCGSRPLCLLLSVKHVFEIRFVLDHREKSPRANLW